MLTHLQIADIVLIDRASLAFGDGLCVLTGETGAGKSILLDALGLVLGSRADSGLIRSGKSEGTVTAEFDIERNQGAREALENLGIATDDTLIIRRTLNAAGKGRCFINDQPVGVNALRALGECLVEIHGQHDQKRLFEPATHRALLDEYGRHQTALQQVEVAAKAWKAAGARLAALMAEMERAKREEEYLRHIAAELRELKPEAGEEETLTDLRTTMMQSEKLFDVLNDALQDLQKDKGLASAVRSVQRGLLRSPLTQGEAFQPIIDHLDKAAEGVDLAEQALEEIGRSATYNPTKLDAIEERLFALKAAARKYQVSADELATVYEEATAALAKIDRGDRELKEIQAEVKRTREAYVAAAAALTEKRKVTALKLEKAILKELAPLKMGSTAFRVLIAPLEEAQWGAHGQDYITFEVATNVSGEGAPAYAPLQKIASGGELARFMLALKVALSTVRSTSTLIFDEIDTGTGGAVADAIGQRLARLGETAQVLVVTHLPQVAARGSQHFLVAKEVRKKSVQTEVRALTAEERREELARMLSGASITLEARRAAEKLLEDAA